jgi:2'-5' RNA ligase
VTAAAAAPLRLFFALWPDARARDALEAWARRAQSVCGGRLMRPRNLHFTLAFLGDVPAARLEALVTAAGAVPARDLRIDVDRVAYWSHNRIVWAGAAAVPAALAALVDGLRAALDGAGFRHDARPFVPHVTLLRDARPAPLPPFAGVQWASEAFVLVRSVPGQDYAILHEWRVTAA